MADFRYSETVVRTPEDLGRLVRAQRRASALRIDDAAALCGVSVDLLSRLENGHSGVSSERLLKVFDGADPARNNVTKREIGHDELRQRIEDRAQLPFMVWDRRVRMSIAGYQDKLAVYLDHDRML